MKILLVCSSIFALLESHTVNLKDPHTKLFRSVQFEGRPARYDILIHSSSMSKQWQLDLS